MVIREATATGGGVACAVIMMPLVLGLYGSFETSLDFLWYFDNSP